MHQEQASQRGDWRSKEHPHQTKELSTYQQCNNHDHSVQVQAMGSAQIAALESADIAALKSAQVAVLDVSPRRLGEHSGGV